MDRRYPPLAALTFLSIALLAVQFAHSYGYAQENGAVLPRPNIIAVQSESADLNSCDEFSLTFRRNPDLSFTALAWVRDPKNGNCAGVTGSVVEITSSRGSVSAISDHGNGVYSAKITPDSKRTGEYVVQATTRLSTRLLEQSKTALVFDSVSSRWGQPQAVEGRVNTLGWEDSPQITPDGEYLFIMYLPISPSCVLEKKWDSDKQCRNIRGTVNSLNRPGFASRYSGNRLKDGTEKINWDCMEVGALYTQDLFRKYDVYNPPMITYGFRRQPNGSFDQPFPIAIEGVSGCIGPSGLEAHPGPNGKAIALMGLIDPASWNTKQEKDYPDLFTAEIELGKPNSLATWNAQDKKLISGASDLQLIFGKTMKHRQDNPHAVRNHDTNNIDLIFWDSEHYDEDIFYRALERGGKFPEGPWGVIRKTPVFSEAGEMEIQPFFDGKVLTVTRRYEIVSRDFLGQSNDELADPKLWGSERIELGVDKLMKGNETEVLHAVGDATYATRQGKKVLYFVYMTRRGDGNLDLNVGFVEEQNSSR